MRSAPPKEDTHPLSGGRGRDDLHGSLFDNGTKEVFGESLLLTVVLAV